ncbi:UBE3A [Symbiodinium natans]|uniref:UBE3A protein n=1 Tax=Symbiodinium natans TaxID=878477 RepID=A0A812QLK8_9DINO|nr:UBE3A [Symbiodinium natans]
MSSGDSPVDPRSPQLRLLDRQTSNVHKGYMSWASGNLVVPHDLADRTSLPRYHRRVTEDRTAVLVVPLNSPLETRTLIDSWLSCCLHGSPSLLCFFVDSEGICRGCRFVLAADIPHLEDIAKAYRIDEHKRLSNEEVETSTAFDPTVLREASHNLLEALIDRCDHDGGHFLLVPGPFGPRLVRAGPQASDDDCEEPDEVTGSGPGQLSLPSSEELELARLEQMAKTTAPRKEDTKMESSPSSQRWRAVLVTKALLSYHAAVRLAQSPMTSEAARSRTELKHVPSGARWTAKSCCHPLRVRQMMLRSVRALRSAARCAEDGSDPPPLPCRFQLLMASAFEFLADTFLAEDEHGDVDLDLSRMLSALRHLQRSRQHAAEYASSVLTSNLESSSRFARSVRQLEERIHAKAINAHLCLARLRQSLSCGGDLRMIGPAMKELDAAEELVTKPRAGQPQRSGAYESSLLSSICKWKADLLHELATLLLPSVAPGQELDPDTRSYIEAQVAGMNDSMQPPAMQCERWLQSTVSLCLRSLHQLAAVPSEVAAELQLQVRALLARAYSKLGRLYASTGRFTKAMTHAKQGIELFNATKDKVEAAKLQIWLCRLQLRMAVPQAASTTRSTDCHFLDKDPGLLGGLSAAASSEESALQQVVQQLQKALSALDSTESRLEQLAEEELSTRSEGQVLLGKVLFRQALVRLAKAPSPLNACSRLGEEAILVSTLDILQTAEAKLGQSAKEAAKEEIVKEAMERLHQAAACFRSAKATVPCCSVHLCLAFVYFCTAGNDTRLQRLAMTHCQHSLEQWTASHERSEAVGVSARLLEAKAARRIVHKGRPAWAGDAKAASLLCEVAISRLTSTELPTTGSEVASQDPEPASAAGAAGAAGTAGAHNREEQMRNALLSTGEDQGASLMSYVRQELSTVLLRLLKACEQDDAGRDLKVAYCSLLTAWHEASGQVEALHAVLAQTRKILGRDLPP